MRTAEHGLRALARKLKVRLTSKGKNQPIELAEWNKVIDGIKVALDAASKLPHTVKRAGQLHFYSEAADHCLYMKELRNTVSHTRKSFDELEALASMGRVKSFMAFIANGLAKR
jgi:hypothetical protein